MQALRDPTDKTVSNIKYDLDSATERIDSKTIDWTNYIMIAPKEKYKKEKRSLLPDETDQPIFSTLSGKVFDSNVKYQNYARVMTLALVNSAVFCNCHCNQDKEENGFIHANKIC